MNIMFMGTESFALTILQALVENCINDQISVVTQTDKPRGRGHKVVFDCVKEYALQQGLPIYQPENLKEENFALTLRSEDPRLIVVASYGKILPQYVLDYPPCGCVNVHASLLPAYRGAAPIQRAIMNGEEKTGVTLMYMATGLDTGNMLAKTEISIGKETSGELRAALAEMGAELLQSYLPRLSRELIESEKQDEGLASYAQKITSEDRPLDFARSAKEIICQIKGLSPTPGAICTIQSSRLSLKVLDAEELVCPQIPEGECGELIRPAGLKKNQIAVKCGEGAVCLTLLQPEGGKMMDAASLINGRKITFPDKLL